MPQRPEPFLDRPFHPDTEAPISTGWLYHEDEKSVHGIEEHQAIDFDASRGTPVVAAHEGWAIATFDEFPLIEDEARPRTIEGEPLFFGAGLLVQVWHGRGRYTQYAHLDSVADSIPYYEPVAEAQALRPQHLRVPVARYGKQIPAYLVEAGEPIGSVGITGMGKNCRTYDDWKAGRPYQSYQENHLHFAVFSRRRDKARTAVPYDPFNLHQTVEHYPPDPKEWPGLPGSLWSKAAPQ